MATIQDVWQRRGTATRVLNTEIRKEIIRQNAVDTGRMRNVTKVIDLDWNENKDSIDFNFNTTFYYKFVQNRKARKWKNGSVPRNITAAFLKREKVLEQMDKLVSVIFEYKIDEQFR